MAARRSKTTQAAKSSRAIKTHPDRAAVALTTAGDREVRPRGTWA